MCRYYIHWRNNNITPQQVKLFLLYFIGVRVSPVAGLAGDRKRGIANHGMLYLKIFFVDLHGHAHHGAGDAFFRLFIAGKIHVA